MEELVRFGVSMNAKLLAKFDNLIEKKGYQNRSEAIRDLVREFLVEEEWKQGGDQEVAGTISIVYDHHTNGLSELLTAIQHQYYNLITSTIHVHLDHHNCMEVLVVRGAAAQIKEIADRLTSVKGVKQGKLTITSIAPELL